MSGDIRSLQNCSGAGKAPGGSDSHTPPPSTELFRQIPSVSEMLENSQIKGLCEYFGEELVKLELRRVLEDLRVNIRNNSLNDMPDIARLIFLLRQRLECFTSAGRHVINATGILLHTGLGRAPLCKEAVEALTVMGKYSLLQADPASGKRSLRDEKVEQMLISLTGCEAATVVNNNAAATMLVLNTLAAGKSVIISRGQLIEIGGEFRMPDVFERSSVILHEVGTTNRTHLRDYEQAIGQDTGALLHVHTSNYRVRGFAGTPDVFELCDLGRKYSIPVIDDLGSGALVKLSKFGIPDEPLVQDSISAGTDVVCFSADKLISGPQAGIICGKKALIDNIRKNPFARMFRVCKLTLAALEATLIHFINGTYIGAIPFYQMLAVSNKTLEARAKFILRELNSITGIKVSVIDDVSYIGSGALPDEGIPSKVVRISFNKFPEGISSIDEISAMLRLGVPTVFCRIQDNSLYIDTRTLFENEEIDIVKKIGNILK